MISQRGLVKGQVAFQATSRSLPYASKPRGVSRMPDQLLSALTKSSRMHLMNRGLTFTFSGSPCFPIGPTWLATTANDQSREFDRSSVTYGQQQLSKFNLA